MKRWSFFSFLLLVIFVAMTFSASYAVTTQERECSAIVNKFLQALKTKDTGTMNAYLPSDRLWGSVNFYVNFTGLGDKLGHLTGWKIIESKTVRKKVTIVVNLRYKFGPNGEELQSNWDFYLEKKSDGDWYLTGGLDHVWKNNK